MYENTEERPEEEATRLARELEELTKGDQLTSLKREINNIVWENSPGTVTLEQAEERACEILELVMKP